MNAVLVWNEMRLTSNLRMYVYGRDTSTKMHHNAMDANNGFCDLIDAYSTRRTCISLSFDNLENIYERSNLAVMIGNRIT